MSAGVSFQALSTSMNVEQASIDLWADGNAIAPNNGVTFNGCSAGVPQILPFKGWNMPPAAQKSKYTFISCDQPTGATLDARGVISGLQFSGLPGRSGVFGTIQEGET